MASLTRVGLRESERAKQNLGSDQSLASHMELNCKYRIFARMYNTTELLPEADRIGMDDEWDLLTVARLGRTADRNVCGTSFIVYDDTMATIDDETGKPVDLVGMEPWKRICRILHAAAAMREKKNAEAEAERTARELLENVDEKSLKSKLDEIDIKYFGGEVAGKKIMPDVQPGLSGFQWKTLTQVAVVKLDTQGVPQWKDAFYAILEISKTKSNQLKAAINNKDYYTPGDEFIELSYDYTGETKKVAGQSAALQGVAESLKLSKQYPELWEKYGKNFVNGIVKGKNPIDTSARMANRSMALSIKTDPSVVITNIRKYFATNKALAGSIDMESDETKRVSVDLIESGILDTVPAIKEKVMKLAEERKAAVATGEEQEFTEEEQAKQATEAQAIAALGEADNKTALQDIMNTIGEGDDLLADDLD